jgi:hypothetical protein
MFSWVMARSAPAAQNTWGSLGAQSQEAFVCLITPLPPCKGFTPDGWALLLLTFSGEKSRTNFGSIE